MDTSCLKRRGKIYYLCRRTPTRFHDVAHSSMNVISLHTDSLQTARRKADEVWDNLLDGWQAKLDGLGTEGDDRINAARNIAQKRGYQYLDVEHISKLSLDELMKRINLVRTKSGRINRLEAEALLGLVPQANVKVSESVEEFYRVAADRMIGKSPDQLRRHREARARAVNHFVEAVGDLSLAKISTEDLFRFRNWWLSRITGGEVTAGTANKDFSYLVAMWRAIGRAKSIKLRFETGGLALRQNTSRSRTRPPFSDEWIKTRLLASGALHGLDTEARVILLGMINTGYRPSEGAALTAGQIHLEGEVPFIEIKSNLRALKTSASERRIPLTGISLVAFQAHSTGFPNYADNPALTDIINDYLQDNGLRETPKHTMYGLRHSFEDRMLEAGIDERIRRDLLGHSLNRERYGQGGKLTHIRGLLLKIAL